LRVIGGKAKGMRLKSGKGLDVRPTADRVKESVFNMLGQYISGDFLDVFAGYGGIGIEAASRGAQSVTFIEKDRGNVGIIRENCDKARIDNIVILQMDFRLALERLARDGKVFDYVFIDPPYRQDLISPVLELLPALLKSDSVVVVEQPKKEELPLREGYVLTKTRSLGDSKVSFLKLQGGSF